MPESHPASGRTFRPDIEGLRAVAVGAVLLFHAAVPGAAGGYVGVDVFFVLSGFLITGLLWREVGRSGRVRFGSFYAARARRLLPAAITALIATAAAATVLLPPLQVRAALGDAIACAVYAGNYRFALQGTDYLQEDAPPSPFQHYWSLGAEEQFYLLWPALLVLAAWLARRLGRGTAARPSVAGPVVALALVAGGSFAVSLAWTRGDPSWAYFSLPSRAWELAVGGLVALSAPWWRRVPAAAAAAAGWAELAEVASVCVACPELAATRTQVVVGDVPLSGRPRFVLVGEAPGATEDETGRPFVGRSGALLDLLLAEAGLDRADGAVLNVVKCRPPGNRTPRRAEVARCSGWLRRQLDLLAPPVVVALGLSSAKWFLGPRTVLAEVRGRPHQVDGRAVWATYHPSAAIRFGPNGAPRAALAADLAAVAAFLTDAA